MNNMILHGFCQELEKIAEFKEKRWPYVLDLAGLGTLAVPAVYSLATKKHMPPNIMAGFEVGGLGMLAGSVGAHLRRPKSMTPKTMVV